MARCSTPRACSTVDCRATASPTSAARWRRPPPTTSSRAIAPVGALISSPLQRTQQSAEPIAAAFELEPALDDRVIEPENRFEGKRMRGPDGALRDLRNWALLVNPWEPSWGEPFRSIADRMMARDRRRLGDGR